MAEVEYSYISTSFQLIIGFLFIQSGIVRFKNLNYVLMINIYGMFISSVVYWMIGFAFGFGETNGQFIGGNRNAYFGQNIEKQYAEWILYWLILQISIFIINGATAERFKITGYSIFIVIYTSTTYPILMHWIQEEKGWLSELKVGYKDFLSSSAFSIIGGASGLIGSVLLSQRKNRFSRTQFQFEPNSAPLVVLGTFFILIGWLGLTQIQNQVKDKGINQTGEIIFNLILSSLTSGIVSALFSRLWRGKLQDYQQNTIYTCYGIISGLVACSGCCDQIYGWGAIIIGAVSGILMVFFSRKFQDFSIDDPLESISIFLINGIWNAISTGIFYRKEEKGALYGGGQIGIQLLGLFMILVTSLLITFIYMKILTIKSLNIGRNEIDLEEIGFDNLKNQETDDKNMVLAEAISQIYSTKGQSISKLLSNKQKNEFINQLKLLYTDLEKKLINGRTFTNIIQEYTMQVEIRNRIKKQKQQTQLKKQTQKLLKAQNTFEYFNNEFSDSSQPFINMDQYQNLPQDVENQNKNKQTTYSNKNNLNLNFGKISSSNGKNYIQNQKINEPQTVPNKKNGNSQLHNFHIGLQQHKSILKNKQSGENIYKEDNIQFIEPKHLQNKSIELQSEAQKNNLQEQNNQS